MDKNYEKMIDLKIELLKKNALTKNFDFTCLDNKEELIDFIKNTIPDNSTIGLGGSQTLIDIGVLSLIYQMNVRIFDRYKEGLTPQQRKEVFRESFTADYYLTSTNALTTDCTLYNIDGTGNRVAAMIYGPEHVLVICGINKLFDDEASAISHVRNNAAVANAIRLNRNTPCTKLGYCVNCNSEERICDNFVKISHCSQKKRIHIIIVKETLGF